MCYFISSFLYQSRYALLKIILLTGNPTSGSWINVNCACLWSYMNATRAGCVLSLPPTCAKNAFYTERWQKVRWHSITIIYLRALPQSVVKWEAAFLACLCVYVYLGGMVAGKWVGSVFEPRQFTYLLLIYREKTAVDFPFIHLLTILSFRRWQCRLKKSVTLLASKRTAHHYFFLYKIQNTNWVKPNG